MAGKDTNIALARPCEALERLAADVTRIFDDFGLGRGSSRAPAPSQPIRSAPRADLTQHQDEIVVRFDLPGIEMNDVQVNVADGAITIHGERHRAPEEERDVVYRTERQYGAFSRTLELPAGAISGQATSSLKAGVLEIRMPAAPRPLGEQK
jgi:HSP20 family protein